MNATYALGVPSLPWESILWSEYQAPSHEEIVFFLKRHPLICDKDAYRDGTLVDEVASLFANKTFRFDQIRLGRDFLNQLLEKYRLVEAQKIVRELEEGMIDLVTKRDLSLCQEPQIAEEEISLLKAHNFKPITDVRDIDGYVGKIVAYVSSSPFHTRYKPEPLDRIEFGYIDTELQGWGFGEKGYNLIHFTSEEDDESVDPLIESKICGFDCSHHTLYYKEPKWFDYFCVREASYQEVCKIQKAFKEGSIHFSYDTVSAPNEILQEHADRLAPKNTSVFNYCILV